MKSKVLIAILIMLMLIAAIVAWLIFGYGRQKNEEKNAAYNVVKIAEVGGTSLVDATDISEGLDLLLAEHVFSHRGAEGYYEHSFKAYDEAITAGSRYIEQDVVLSSDGVLFVSHDLNAASMTGSNANYSSMRADEVDQLQTKAGYKVLRLSEVFDKYGKDINYVIELKSADAAMREAFKQIVDEYDYQDNIIVQSEYMGVLEDLEDKYPDMPKLAVCKTQGAVEDSLNTDCVDIISVRYYSGLMTEDNCEAAHNKGKQFSAWTINSESAIREAIDMGVDSYFTDDTALAISLEKQYRVKRKS